MNSWVLRITKPLPSLVSYITEVGVAAGYGDKNLAEIIVEQTHHRREYLNMADDVVGKVAKDQDFNIRQSIIKNALGRRHFKSSQPFLLRTSHHTNAFGYGGSRVTQNGDLRFTYEATNPIFIEHESSFELEQFSVFSRFLEIFRKAADRNHDIIETVVSAVAMDLSDTTNTNGINKTSEQVVANVHNRIMAARLRHDEKFRKEVLSEAIEAMLILIAISQHLQRAPLAWEGDVSKAHLCVANWMERFTSVLTFHTPIHPYASQVVDTIYGNYSLDDVMPGNFIIDANKVAKFLNERDFGGGRKINPRDVDHILYQKDNSGNPALLALQELKRIIRGNKLSNGQEYEVEGFDSFLAMKVLGGYEKYDLSHVMVRNMSTITLSEKCLIAQVEGPEEIVKSELAVKRELFERLGGHGKKVDTMAVYASCAAIYAEMDVPESTRRVFEWFEKEASSLDGQMVSHAQKALARGRGGKVIMEAPDWER